jgi:hypothetical protein
VSDTDPENEIGNVPGPAYRDLVSPCADAGGNLVANAKKSEGRDACSDGEGHPPPAGRGCSTTPEIRSGQPAKVAPVQNKRDARELRLRSLIVSGAVGAPSMLYGRSTCGLRADKMSMFLFLIPAISPQNLRTPMFSASGIFGFGLRMRAR